jgi:hypothetical protein
LAPETAQCGPLYAAVGSGSTGHLYILDPADGSVITDVGALVDATGTGVGITGLAFHPTTGVLYGVTMNSGYLAHHLVAISTVTGFVTDIGDLNPGTSASTMADITFDPITGVLYGWSAASGHQLATIDIITGAATRFGPGTGEFGGGGLAADAAGTLYVSPDGSTSPPGSLKTLDKALGTFLTSVPLAPGSVLNSLTFDGGTLYGIRGGGGGGGFRELVIVDPATGAVTIQGVTVSFLDAIAAAPAGPVVIPEPTTLALAGTGLAYLLRRRFAK